MISSKTLILLKDTIKNEFHLTAEAYDAQGKYINDSGSVAAWEPQLDVSALPAEEGTVIPLVSGEDLFGYLKLQEEVSPEIVSAIKLFVRAVWGYEEKGLRINRVFQEETVLVSRMLSEDAKSYHNDIIAFGADLGYKLEHPMALIVASLETNYNYCLNMNLGYESATNDAKNSIIKLVKEHAYMNKQDIVAFVQNNCLVVLKAIEELSDLPKLYKVMDKVAEAVSDVLKSYRLFRYYIAPPEIIMNIDAAYHTYKEALECISYAQKTNLDHPVISHDDVLYYVITSRLPNKVRVESVNPKVECLLSQNREMVESLIQCFDAYIDNGFNIASTADAVYMHRNTVKKKLDKLYQITGFDPAGDFRDIMMNKLILQQYLVESRGR